MLVAGDTEAVLKADPLARATGYEVLGLQAPRRRPGSWTPPTPRLPNRWPPSAQETPWAAVVFQGSWASGAVRRPRVHTAGP